MISPFLGASIVVWTSLIGVIMASLAAGYYAGGRIADARPNPRLLSALIAGAALWVVLLTFVQRSILMALLSGGVNNIYVLSITAALLFFGVPSFLLATVSPFVIRLFASDKEKIGGIAGKVSASATIGSIVGTFLGGFILVSFFSVTLILLMTALVIGIASIIMFSLKLKNALALGLAAFGAFAGLYHAQKALITNVSIETMYNSLFVSEQIEEGRRVRSLYTDSNKLQGRIYVDNPDEMAAEYLRFIGDAFVSADVESILMLGGGVYVFPRWLASSHPATSIDVVEIDPGITQAARDFFYLADRPGQRVFHEDARYFVNRLSLETASAGAYDLIFQDTYGSSFNVPFQLSTLEFFKRVNTLLSDEGVFVFNFMGSLDSAMFSGLHAAISESFPHVRVFPVNEPYNTKALQNIILAAYKSGSHRADSFTIPEYRGALYPETAAFSDAFAPVERYTMLMLR